jgi:hypothetical protein
MKLLNRIFGQAEELNGGEHCPTYMYRWVLLRTRWGNFYLHKFVRDDWTLDFHDHPRRFISIGLLGSYLEHTPDRVRRFTAPWIRSFPPEHKHRITTPWGACWTLVIVGQFKREWRFWNAGKFILWREYVYSTKANERKDC